jgi:hypothetical protein
MGQTIDKAQRKQNQRSGFRAAKLEGGSEASSASHGLDGGARTYSSLLLVLTSS